MSVVYGFDSSKNRKEVLSKEDAGKITLRTYKSLTEISSSLSLSSEFYTILGYMAIPSIAYYTVPYNTTGIYPAVPSSDSSELGIVRILHLDGGNTDIEYCLSGKKYIKTLYAVRQGYEETDWRTIVERHNTVYKATKGMGALSSDKVDVAITGFTGSLNDFIPVISFTTSDGQEYPSFISAFCTIDAANNKVIIEFANYDKVIKIFTYKLILLRM